MSLITTGIKIPESYDSWRIYDIDFPKFKIPLHSTFDGIKMIPEFDIKFLSQNGIVNSTQKDHFYDITFLRNFGKCTVLKGLKDPSREFNILCILFNNNIYWLYLANEEYANLLLKYNDGEVKNSYKFHNPLSVSKIYKVIEDFNHNIYKDYKISVSKYDPSDKFTNKTVIGLDRIDHLRKNDEFIVLQQHNILSNIDELEQQNASFISRYAAIADNMYYILGIGREFLGYISLNGLSNTFLEEIETD